MSKQTNRVLYIDLGESTYEVVEQPELFERWLGGSGLALQLLLKECPPKIDPFAPENPIIMAPGPLGGLFTGAGKTVATFKSPITGNLGESHAGGRLASCLRMAGYSAMVMQNSAATPTLLEIGGKDVHFRDASPVKGFSSFEVERRLRGCAAVARFQSILSIGPAGENRIAYACVNVDRYNYFGRLGLGAVFGSKNLKAISVLGSGEIEVPNLELYKKTFKEIYNEEIETNKMAKYHFTGTPANVLVLHEIRALPTKNFQQGRFEEAEAICGETLGERWLERKVSCPLCPIGCMHVARLRQPFASGYEFESFDAYYNYESLYALGSNLCIKTAEGTLNLILRANMLGVDTMLLGNVLAWATEAYEKGLINTEQTAGVKPLWGDTEAYTAMIEQIGSKSNEFYAKLGEGVQRAAEAYGGEEYAISIGGNGLAGYYTGYASILGTLIGTRHSHNNNAGYDIDQRMLHQNVNSKKIVGQLVNENEWRGVLTSLVICLFARRVYTQERIIQALKAVGIERSAKELEQLGKEIYQKSFEFKFREGFSFDKVKIPHRFFESPTANGKLDEATFKAMLNEFVRKEFGVT